MSDLQGTDVLFRRWEAPGRPKAAFLFVHGLGAHSARWDFFARHAAERGFASYAIELRGFGRTPERPRGHVGSFEVWRKDLLALRETIAADHPGTKVVLAGESMGGLVAYDVAGRFPQGFAGAVVMAPAFKNGMKFPLSAYVKLALFTPFNPRLMIDLPFTSAMATRDRDYAAVMDANPDELRRASLGLMSGFLPLQARAGRLAKTFPLPVLFLVPGVDHLVDESGARRIFAKLAAADKTLLEYPDMFHALYIDLGRDRVFADVLDWAAKRV